jgi:hypothetical protein
MGFVMRYFYRYHDCRTTYMRVGQRIFWTDDRSNGVLWPTGAFEEFIGKYCIVGRRQK